MSGEHVVEMANLSNELEGIQQESSDDKGPTFNQTNPHPHNLLEGLHNQNSSIINIPDYIIPEVSPMLEQSKNPTPHLTLSRKLEKKIPKEEINFVRQPFVPEDFLTELRYSLWTDLCGEQTEFQDALE